VLHVVVLREVGEPEKCFIVSILGANTAFLTRFVADVPTTIVSTLFSTLSAYQTAIFGLLLFVVVALEC